MTIALLAVAAFIVGLAKTSIGGLATIAVAIFATVVPARESTAAILLLLIVGDVMAVAHYRRDCDWSLLRNLLPAVVPGVLLGTWFLAVVDDTVLRRFIGGVVAAMVLVQLALRWRARDRVAPAGQREVRRSASLGTGVAAGFTTMTANAAGPVMALYFIASGFDKRRFLGTSAWYFLIINLFKVPFSAGLGLFTQTALLRTLWLAPIVVIGALVGVRVARRLTQRRFDVLVLAATAVAAVALLL